MRVYPASRAFLSGKFVSMHEVVQFTSLVFHVVGLFSVPEKPIGGACRGTSIAIVLLDRTSGQYTVV